mmetsp:Transcript_116633/g.370999  ORF Transcript_116633/g.370999 Transcript_116633/m.370999 type:complete len:226 (-) Transcript_116633:161-838(-)
MEASSSFVGVALAMGHLRRWRCTILPSDAGAVYHPCLFHGMRQLQICCCPACMSAAALVGVSHCRPSKAWTSADMHGSRHRQCRRPGAAVWFVFCRARSLFMEVLSRRQRHLTSLMARSSALERARGSDCHDFWRRESISCWSRWSLCRGHNVSLASTWVRSFSPEVPRPCFLFLQQKSSSNVVGLHFKALCFRRTTSRRASVYLIVSILVITFQLPSLIRAADC